MLISVQQEDFDVAAVTRELCGNRKDIGAVVTFSGIVRDQSTDQSLVVSDKS